MSLPPAPGGRGLSRDRIVASALDLARREGLAGVSMRRVAGELGVEAMSLYHYVPSKAVLLVLMADWSVSRLPRPDPAIPWDERLVELLTQTYLAGVENPALFEVIASEPLEDHSVRTGGLDVGAPSTGLLEMVLVMLDEAELPVEQQVHAYRGLIGLVIGFIVVQVDGFLSHASSTSGSRVAQRPERDATSRLSLIRPVLEQTDPVAGLRVSLRWFLQGMLSTAGSGREERSYG